MIGNNEEVVLSHDWGHSLSFKTLFYKVIVKGL